MGWRPWADWIRQGLWQFGTRKKKALRDMGDGSEVAKSLVNFVEDVVGITTGGPKP